MSSINATLGKASSDASGTHCPKGSLKARMIRGSIWTILGFGCSQLLRLGSNVVLTRLLFPKAFGLMSLVNVFLQGLRMFSDIGIGPSIVQNSRGHDPTFLDTAWTIQAIRGALLWIVSCLLAWPVAMFYGEPALCWLIPVAGLTALISGSYSTSLVTFSRDLKLDRLVVLELSAQTTGIVVMIVVAYIHRSVWALVAGSLATVVCTSSLSWVLATHRNWFAWEAEARKALLRFGRAVFISTAVLFLANQSERLIMGRFVSLEILGVYTVAYTLSQIGTQVVQKLLQRVFFPGLAQVFRDRPERVPMQYKRARWVIDIGSITMTALLVRLGPPIVRTMYDSRYWEACWMVQILAIQAAWDIMRAPASYVLLAAGKPQYGAWASASRVVVLSAGLLLVFLLVGPEYAMKAAVWVIALSSMPPFLIYVVGMTRTFPSLAKNEWTLGLAGCIVLSGLYRLLR